jgi:hypothetical protein
MKPCVRDTTARGLGYAPYLPHEFPPRARKAARWRLFPALLAQPELGELEATEEAVAGVGAPVTARLALREPVPHAAAGHPARRPRGVAAVPLGGGADRAVVDGAVLLVVLHRQAGPYGISTEAGVHDDVPKQPPGMSGDMGEYSDGRGRAAPSSMPLPRSAWFAPFWARTGGSPWGLRTCPINRTSRVAKANRNRQARTNNVPFFQRARY